MRKTILSEDGQSAYTSYDVLSIFDDIFVNKVI